MTKFFKPLLVVMAVLTIGGCTAEPTVDQNSIDELAQAIEALGPDIDRNEAEQVARIAFNYSLQLKQEYQVTDPPLIHNAKVHQGFRERGLCNHWAEDVTTRLKQEQFDTLTVHWATAPPSSFRIIHHSAVISRRGETIYDGILLDPWRYGGVLFWSPVPEDGRYDWRPRMEVRDELLRQRDASNAT